VIEDALDDGITLLCRSDHRPLILERQLAGVNVYRERPGCRVFWDREHHWIDVEGTSCVAEVGKYMGRRWAGAGAF
jgi:hypothetical protein